MVKILKENNENLKYMSKISSTTTQGIIKCREKMQDFYDYLVNKKGIVLDLLDDKLYNIAYECDLGPGGEWFNWYCEDRWQIFEDELSINGLTTQEPGYRTDSHFYIREENGFLANLTHEFVSGGSIKFDFEEFVWIFTSMWNGANDEPEMEAMLTSDKALEVELTYLVDKSYLDIDEVDNYVSNLVSGFNSYAPVYIKEYKDEIDNTASVYEWFEMFKEEQVSDYNEWLEWNKDENSEAFNTDENEY